MHTAEIAAFDGDERDLARLLQQWQLVCLLRDLLAAAGDEYLSAQQTYKHMREKQKKKKKIAHGERGAVYFSVCV
jgi:hypothetical protein